MKNNILKLGIVLALYASLACTALAVVEQFTGPIIEGHQSRQLQESQQDLFPEADAFTEIPLESFSTDVQKVNFTGAWQARSGNRLLGVILKVAGSSYGGKEAIVLVGIGSNLKIDGTRILTLSDTPGLGANAVKANYYVNKPEQITFPGQFTGMAVSSSFDLTTLASDNENTVIAITASTITSLAITTMVKAAAQAGTTWLGSNSTGGN